MIADIAQVMQDESLLADELKIIAGERNGLTEKDRVSIRHSALLLDETLKSYGLVFFRLKETEAQLTAAQERLREANLALAKSNIFPTLAATTTISGWRP